MCELTAGTGSAWKLYMCCAAAIPVPGIRVTSHLHPGTLVEDFVGLTAQIVRLQAAGLMEHREAAAPIPSAVGLRKHLPDLSKLTNLTALNLSDNSLTRVPPVLCKLQKLQYLDLSCNAALQVCETQSRCLHCTPFVMHSSRHHISCVHSMQCNQMPYFAETLLSGLSRIVCYPQHSDIAWSIPTSCSCLEHGWSTS